MRQCRCGGVVRQHGLTGGREAWTCSSCGQYSVIDREQASELVVVTTKGHSATDQSPGSSPKQGEQHETPHL